MVRAFACSILLSALGMSSHAIAAEYFLSTSGDDSNSGAKTQPWRSLQKSIWKIKAGDTLTVRGGTYHEASYADISTASTGKTSVIRAASGERVVFDGRVPTESVIRANSWKSIGSRTWATEYIGTWKWLDGLWVDGRYLPKVAKQSELMPGSWSLDAESKRLLLKLEGDESPSTKLLQFRLGFMITFDSPYWRIEGITANHFTQYGIGVWNTHHVTVRDCDAHYNGGGGIDVSSAGDILLENNRTSFNGSEGGPGWSSGIHLYGLTNKRNIVRRNISHQNWDPSNHHTDGNGFSIDKGYSDGGAEVYENIAYANGGRGLDVMETADVRLSNNTFFNNSLDPHIENQGELSIYGEVSLSGLWLRDNIFFATRKNFPLVIWGELDGRKIRGDYNLFYNSDSPGRAVVRMGKETTPYSLEEWRKASGNEIHSLGEDPMLRSPIAADFTPLAGSPVLGNGSRGGTIGVSEKQESVASDFHPAPVRCNQTLFCCHRAVFKRISSSLC